VLVVLIICMMTARAAEAALELCERGYKESANSNRFPLTTYLRYEKKLAWVTGSHWDMRGRLGRLHERLSYGV